MRLRWYGIPVLLLCLAGTFSNAQTLPAPSGLSGSVQFHDGGSPSVVLTWHAMSMSGDPVFEVFRSEDDTNHFMLQAQENGTFYADRDVSLGHVYFYFVDERTSHNGVDASSGPSNVVSVSVAGDGMTTPHGFISGTVTDSVTGNPLAGIHLAFFRASSDEDWGSQSWTDSAGHFRVVLDTGSYVIHAEQFHMEESDHWPMMGARYAPEWFDDSPDAEHAARVSVADSSEFTADFDLKPLVLPTLASVSGIVTDTSGAVLEGATVVFTRSIGEMEVIGAAGGDSTMLHGEDADIDGFGRWHGAMWKGTTDSLGHYTAHVAAGRTYTAFAFKEGYLPQFSRDETDPRKADPIVVSGDTSGVDFSLTPKTVFQNSITGMVHDSSGAGVASRVLLVTANHGSSKHAARFVSTDSAGAFSFTNIVPGTYFVMVIPFDHFAPAFYKANECGIMRWQDADSLVVSGSSNMTGIDVCVDVFAGAGMASVSGKVLSSGSALPGANVFALNASGAAVGYAVSDAQGAYTIAAVPPGQLSILADQPGYQDSRSGVLVAAGQSSVGGMNLSLASITTTVDPTPAVPTVFSLGQNYPNPFNPSTQIQYALPDPSNVQLIVYNLLGQEIRLLSSGFQASGGHTVTWDGKDKIGRSVSSGIYLYRLHAVSIDGANTFTMVRKMVVIR